MSSDNIGKGSPQETILMIESGYLDLSLMIDKGILFLGKTKAGKTTSAHYVTHQVLEGDYNNQKDLVYKLKSTNKKEYMDARIGDNATRSQTQIPNVFGIDDEKEGKINVVDCPGYVDSYGCFRITSNRFFHYQVFSKVKNIKFVIVFNYSDMIKRADNMRQTFKQFLKGFKDINQIKQQLIAATSVIITGVPKVMDRDQIMLKYENTPQLTGDLNSIYEQLKKDLLKKGKIFIFNAPEKVGEVCNTNNTILEQINKSTKFWKRDIINSEVDTKNININLLSYVDPDSEVQFFKELEQFCSYYRENVIKEFKSLVKVFNLFSNDNQNQNSFEFLQQIIKLVEEKRNWRKTVSKCQQLYLKYQEKRNKAKNSLFKQNVLFSSASTSTGLTDVPLWVAKLKALLKIQKLTQKYMNKLEANTYEDCQEAEKNMKYILNFMANMITLQREPNEERQKKKHDAVSQYFYEIIKDIEISNRLYRLMTNNRGNNQTNKKQEEGLRFILQEYPTSLRTFFINAVGKSSATEIFRKRYNKITFKSNLTPSSAGQIISFLQQIKEHCLHDTELKMNQDQENEFKAAVDLLIINLNNKIFEGLKKQSNPSLKSLKEMQDNRKMIVNKIIESNKKAQQSHKLQAENNRVIQLMAECLLKNNQTALALKLYDILFDGHKVLQILEADDMKYKKSKKEDERIDYLINYSEKALKYERRELAMIKSSQAFHLAQETANQKKTIEISKLMKSIIMGNNPKTDFLEFLNKEICYAVVPPQLSENILKLAANAKPK